MRAGSWGSYATSRTCRHMGTAGSEGQIVGSPTVQVRCHLLRSLASQLHSVLGCLKWLKGAHQHAVAARLSRWGVQQDLSHGSVGARMNRGGETAHCLGRRKGGSRGRVC